MILYYTANYTIYNNVIKEVPKTENYYWIIIMGIVIIGLLITSYIVYKRNKTKLIKKSKTENKKKKTKTKKRVSK